MIMADVLKIFLLVLGMLIVIVSYWLAAESLFPRMVARAQARNRRSATLGEVTDRSQP